MRQIFNDSLLQNRILMKSLFCTILSDLGIRGVGEGHTNGLAQQRDIEEEKENMEGNPVLFIFG